MVALSFIFGTEGGFPFPWALLPVAGSFCLLAGIVFKNDSRDLIKSSLSSDFMTWIGKRSYSIYLWHWPVLVLMRWTVGLESAAHLVAGFILSILLGHMSYQFVELPVRQSRFQVRFSAWKIVCAGLVLTLGSVCVVNLSFRNRHQLSLSRTADTRTWYVHAWADASRTQSSGAMKNRRLFMWGDSHAGAYLTMVEALKDNHGGEVNVISRAGLAVLKLLEPTWEVGELHPLFLEEYQKIKAQAKVGDILFLPALRVNRFCDPFRQKSEDEISMYSDHAVKKRVAAMEEAIQQLELLTQLPVTIVIEAPKPVLRVPPFRCSDWFNRMNPIGAPGFTMRRSELLHHRAPIMEMLDSLSARFPEIVIWDPLPILCPDETFHAFDGNRPLFFDGDHLSAHGNRVLYPHFETLILELIGQ